MTEAPHIEAAAFAGFQISEDGRRVEMRLSAGDDGRFVALTIPVDKFTELYQHTRLLMDSTIQAGVVAPMQSPSGGRPVQSWKVGASNRMELARFTAIMFDAGLTSEMILLMPDLQALAMADAIQQKVLAGFSEDEKRTLMKEVEEARAGKRDVRTPPRLLGRV